MARKKHTPEQIVAILRQIEVAIANDKPAPQACREAGITKQSYCHHRLHGCTGFSLGTVGRWQEFSRRPPAAFRLSEGKYAPD